MAGSAWRPRPAPPWVWGHDNFTARRTRCRSPAPFRNTQKYVHAGVPRNKPGMELERQAQYGRKRHEPVGPRLDRDLAAGATNSDAGFCATR